MDFVALTVESPSPDRREVAAATWLDGALGRHLFLLGFDPLAVRARAHAEPTVEVHAAEDLNHTARKLVELSGGAPWIAFDEEPTFAAWRAEDGTGFLSAVRLLDLGELFALAAPTASGRSLGEMAAALGGDAVEPLPGVARAVAVAELWRRVPEAVAALPYAVRATVGELLGAAGSPLEAVWQTAAALPPRPGEAMTIDGLLRGRLRGLTPPPPEAGELGESRPIDVDPVRAMFEPGGPVASLMPAYERRGGQVDMAAAVATAMNEGGLLLCEAETGTGKSLAYLAPAAVFALQNGEPVVVSTNTKNLQDQLCTKDIPLVAEALRRAGGPSSVGLRAELIKGRGNYLCVEKLLRDVDETNLFAADDDLLHLAYLTSWAAATATGDLDELSAYLTLRWPRLESFARQLASEAELCTAPQMRDHPCFATVARRRAWDADLLVVNHALTLANAVTAVLPPFRHLVIDEAHNLEDIATEAFGLEVSRRTLLALARAAGASRDPRAVGQRTRRVLGTIGPEAERLLGALSAVEELAARIDQGTTELGEQLSGLVMQRLRRSVDELQQRQTLRLDPSVYEGALGDSLRAAGDNLRERIAELLITWTELVSGLTELAATRADPELSKVTSAAHAARGDWTEQLRGLELLLRLDDDRYVYWLDGALRREAWEWQLKAAPIEAGAALAERLWTSLASVTLTSATLTVGGSFDHFASRLGLRLPDVAERFRTCQVTSGFDYASQVLLGLPMNIALPQDERFERHVARAICELATLLGGRTLVLFTALGTMRRCFEQVVAPLELAGLEPLCQGVSGNRHVLAERFRGHSGAVLLGTRSFWEGIDVPGDALQAVIIVKLPFAVPDEPVTAARCERLEAQGINAWTAYSIPQAVILFKQGFGRLIRRSTDKGVVICLDRRLREKGYGRAFLNSVPGYRGVFDSWTEVKERVREWLALPEAGA